MVNFLKELSRCGLTLGAEELTKACERLTVFVLHESLD